MESSFLTQIMLPLVLALIMFGMGLSLTIMDFVRLWRMPSPIFIGLLGQLILLPIIAYTVAIVFDLPSHLAIGLMILAACPGGTMSNVISHLVKANLALSVSLTAITTVVCVFSTPFIIRLALSEFAHATDESFSLMSTTVGLFFITLVPVLIGLIVRHKFPEASMRKEVFFQRFSALFMVFMIIAILIQERDLLILSFAEMFGSTISLNLLAIIAGVLIAYLFRLSARDTVTLGIEVGIQNASMAILIAVTFLESPDYAIAAGVYGITMYIGAALLVGLSKWVQIDTT